jgi:regulator of protease activity HflC (stomatin/prohibitin superfamily)
LYWKNRTRIGQEIEVELRKNLLIAHANCTGLMLLKIDMPDTYESAIEETQVVIQQTSTQKKIMNSTLVRQEIEVLRSEANRDIAIINAQADNQATTISNNARAQILSNTITKLSQAYTQVRNTINTDQSKDLLDYIFYMNIMNLDKRGGNTKLLVDVDSALVDLQAQSGKGY